MAFESLFKSGVEKSEEELAIEKAVAEVRGKITEKTTNHEEAKFFNRESKKNLEDLKSKGGPGIFQYSRKLMHIVRENPQLVDKRVRLFHPKTG
ncbi:hypothetical protein KKG58_02825 [Patescibacteria group bacterium]|nr:hypothetical protein [Patescibacteria group bacterium]